LVFLSSRASRQSVQTERTVILRHSDIDTTLAYYVEIPDDQSRAALEEIGDWIMALEDSSGSVSAENQNPELLSLLPNKDS